MKVSDSCIKQFFLYTGEVWRCKQENENLKGSTDTARACSMRANLFDAGGL
jgi:hypothetical protein